MRAKGEISWNNGDQIEFTGNVEHVTYRGVTEEWDECIFLEGCSVGKVFTQPSREANEARAIRYQTEQREQWKRADELGKRLRAAGL